MTEPRLLELLRQLGPLDVAGAGQPEHEVEHDEGVLVEASDQEDAAVRFLDNGRAAQRI